MQSAHDLRAFGSAPLHVEFRISTSADRGEVWPLFADTERFNRAMREDIDYRFEPGADGRIRRIGLTRMGGRAVRYEEVRFDFRSHRGSLVDRHFESGPFSRYTVETRLTDRAEGGTDVTYALDFFPRRNIERPLCALGLRIELLPRLKRVLGGIEQILAGEERSLEVPAPPLTAAARKRLAARLPGIEDSEVAQRLVQTLESAPEAEQDRLQARLLARRWKLPEDRVLDGLLAAVAGGVLEMRWELLCPSCVGPARTERVLDPRSLQAHCPSCNIKYDANFADSVAVTFRPVADLRALDVPLVCVGSPARTPHILARAALAPDQEVEWELDLPPDGYRIRDLGNLDGCHLEVRASGNDTDLLVVLGEARMEPQRMLRAPGDRRIVVRNHRDEPAVVLLETLHRPHATLTAARLLERPRAAELLPEGILPPDLDASIRPAGILVTRLFAPADDPATDVPALLGALEPASLTLGPRQVVATWAGFDAAMDAASRLQGAWQAASAVGFGPVLELGPQEARTVGGSVVLEALDALSAAIPGRTALPGRLVDLPELAARSAGPAPEVAVEAGAGLGGRPDYLLRFLRPPEGLRLQPVETVRPSDEGLEGVALTGRYRLDRQLGRGGFGTVYAATRRDGQAVVVKVLRGELVREPEQVEAFLAEARIGARLDHPHVVRFLDFGHSAAGHLFLVMERLQGRTLSERLADAVLSPQEAVEVASSVLDGLAAMHGAGLLHRDIKPENIFIDDADLRGGTRLLDFGIAVSMQEVAQADPDGTTVGTLAYAAPEQLQADAMDGRTDLYALGVTLFQALSGSIPFSESAPLAMAMARIQQGVPPLLSVRPDVPPALAEVVDRASAFAPQDRYPDALTMRAALLAALR